VPFLVVNLTQKLINYSCLTSLRSNLLQTARGPATSATSKSTPVTSLTAPVTSATYLTASVTSATSLTVSVTSKSTAVTSLAVSES
jgi:hypothetical protein